MGICGQHAFDSFHIQQRRFIRIIAGFSFQFLLFSQFLLEESGKFSIDFVPWFYSYDFTLYRPANQTEIPNEIQQFVPCKFIWEKQLIVIQYLVFPSFLLPR